MINLLSPLDIMQEVRGYIVDVCLSVGMILVMT